MSKKYNVRLYEPIAVVPSGKPREKPLISDDEMEHIMRLAEESRKRRKEREAEDEEYKKLMDLVLGRNTKNEK